GPLALASSAGCMGAAAAPASSLAVFAVFAALEAAETSLDGGTGTTGEPRGVTAPGSGTTSGTAPPLTKVASCSFPRGANARFCAGVGRGSPPPGGPPQMPRWGSLHVMAPAHG